MAHPLLPTLSPIALWSVPTVPDASVEVACDEDGLRKLALQGRWRRLRELLAGSRAASFEQQMMFVTFDVCAALKLHDVTAAAATIGSLGDLEDAPYRYEDEDSGAMVSVVPFALRLMRAVLPHFQNQTSTTINLLYQLLSFVKEELERAAANTRMLSVWQRRHDMVLTMLADVLLSQSRHKAALRCLNTLLKRHPEDAVVWLRVLCVQLTLGCISDAQRTAQRVEQIASTHAQEMVGSGDRGGGSAAQRSERGATVARVQHCVRALIAMAQEFRRCASAKDLLPTFKAAIATMASAAVDDGSSRALFANNTAVCQMYAADLSAAVHTIESSLHNHPTDLLQEGVLQNLCCVYEMRPNDVSLESKRQLSAWVARFAPDDFDLACTRSVT